MGHTCLSERDDFILISMCLVELLEGKSFLCLVLNLELMNLRFKKICVSKKNLPKNEKIHQKAFFLFFFILLDFLRFRYI